MTGFLESEEALHAAARDACGLEDFGDAADVYSDGDCERALGGAGMIITEALDPETIDRVAEVADIVQIGARNMQNFSLLRDAGQCGKPVLLKRGWSATLEEWLCAAEYIARVQPNSAMMSRASGPKV